MISEGAEIKKRLLYKAALKGVPLSGGFELTPRCNFRCPMCYVRMTPEQMAPVGRERTTQEWLALAQEAKAAGMAFLLLTGGEPFLRPDFVEIYRGLAEMGLSICINTNGALLGEEIRQVFAQYPPAYLNITLYATSREGYARQCLAAEGYDRVMDALAWCKAQGILVNLNATISPSNKGQWRQIADFAKAEGYVLRLTSYSFPPERAGGRQDFQRLAPEEAGRICAQSDAYILPPEVLQRRIKRLEELPAGDRAAVGEHLRCFAGRSQFWVSWDGRLMPCGMLSTPCADPFAQGFAAAWGQIQEQTAKITLCPECAGCPDKSTCTNCAAVTFTETGRFDGRPDYMCRFNRAMREEMAKGGK